MTQKNGPKRTVKAVHHIFWGHFGARSYQWGAPLIRFTMTHKNVPKRGVKPVAQYLLDALFGRSHCSAHRTLHTVHMVPYCNFYPQTVRELNEYCTLVHNVQSLCEEIAI